MQQSLLQQLCGWKDAPLPRDVDAVPENLAGLVAKVVTGCAGLPLTLKVLGRYLQRKPNNIWLEALKSLTRAKDLTDSDDKVFRRLRISYDGLDWEEQQMFLDVACLLLGRSAATAKRIWAGSKWPSETGLAGLTGRSLVTVDKDGNLAMHDQLRDMGRAIEACGPAMQQDLPITERNRLWLSNEWHLKSLSKANGALPKMPPRKAACFPARA
ncbi:hypothetical protein WJX72_000747 [[Myrmecia] bisecta]|uniref:Disease resistance protein Roq1-like winged-helix domain-containing protein n=1 Tax=[Myrmecia] bisecta TaxID=41462 RepID=A0AAW1PN64_9CHLO